MTDLRPPAIKRDLSRVRRAFELAGSDLERSGRGSWVCAVDEAFVLRVQLATSVVSVQLSTYVDADGLPPDGEWLRPPLLEFTLEEDALELAVSELEDIAHLWDQPWVTCPVHAHPLTSCAGEWLCGHEASAAPLEQVGRLSR